MNPQGNMVQNMLCDFNQEQQQDSIIFLRNGSLPTLRISHPDVTDTRL